MESLGTAVLELVADIKPLAAGLEKGKAMSEDMAKTTATGFRGGITKAAIPAAAAVAALAVGLHKSVDAAVANQVAQAKLAQAYKAAGLDINAYKDEIDKTEQASAGLGFKSEDVKAALAQLVVATHDSKSAINLLGVAQDVARFKGIGLTDASKLLTTTMAGSARAAHLLGINIAPVTTATDALKSKTQYASLAAYEHAKATAYLADKQATAREMVRLLNEKLGGQAQAFANTAAGAKEKMGAELQLLEINIGNALIPILTKVSTVLAGFSQFLTEHAAIVKIVILVLGTLASGILLYTGYVKLAAAAQTLWNGVMDANPIGLLVVAIAALIVAFVELWKHSQKFRDIVTGVWNDVKDSFLSVPRAFESMWKSIQTKFTDGITFVKSHWKDFAVALATILTGPIGGLVTWLATHWTTIKNDATTAWKAIKTAATSIFGDIGKAIENVLKAPVNMIIGALDALDFGVHYGGLKILGHTIIPSVNFDWHPFHIPMLAEGGIVTSPTLAMIGEAGPEAVVPLSHGAGGLGGVTVNVTGWVGNDQDLATKFGRTLEQLNRRGTKFALA